MIFSAAISDRGLIFFCENSSYWCASILWIFCLSVCWSGYKRYKCNNKETWFSCRLFKIEVWFFFVKVPLIKDHILYECFVRFSIGQATKGINVKKNQRNEFLCPFTGLIFSMNIHLIYKQLFYTYFVCLFDGYAIKEITFFQYSK